MTREELRELLLTSDSQNYVLQLATGMGKTRASLMKIVQWFEQEGECDILIVIPKNNVRTDWINEINKWHYEYLLPHVRIICYASIQKYINFEGIVVFDEGHHLTDRCRQIVKRFNARHTIVLSATLGNGVTRWIQYHYRNTKWVETSLSDAIEDEVLSEPSVILIPLELDNTKISHCIVKKAKRGGLPVKHYLMRDKWAAKKYDGEARIMCTQRQYYQDLVNQIEWAKSTGNQVLVRIKSAERLKWLATEKHQIISDIVSKLDGKTLIFTPSIDESASYGLPCINSKVGSKAKEDFNEGKVRVLTAVGMLDEGEVTPVIHLIRYQLNKAV